MATKRRTRDGKACVSALELDIEEVYSSPLLPQRARWRSAFFALFLFRDRILSSRLVGVQHFLDSHPVSCFAKMIHTQEAHCYAVSRRAECLQGAEERHSMSQAFQSWIAS